MLAISVIAALRHAIAGFGAAALEPRLTIPCTPEAILRAIEDMRTRARESIASAANHCASQQRSRGSVLFRGDEILLEVGHPRLAEQILVEEEVCRCTCGSHG